jgi:hypothetical protein
VVFQDTPDHLLDSIPIRENFMIPKSEDAEPLSMEPFGSSGVVFLLLRVLPAVKFDNQPPVEADEIHYKMTDRDLTTELVFTEPTVSKLAPDERLHVDLVSPKLSGSLTLH